MTANSWVNISLLFLLTCILMPLLTNLIASRIGEWLSAREPWRQGRVLPFIYARPRVDEGAIVRACQTAVVTSRFYASPLKTSPARLRESLRSALAARRSLGILDSIGWLAPPIIAGTLAIYWLVKGHLDVVTLNGVKSIMKAASALVCCRIFQLRFYQFMRQWNDQTGDLRAIISSFGLLNFCNQVAGGRVGLLQTEALASVTCREIERFAETSVIFSSPARRVLIIRHVGAVQQKLLDASGAVLADGVIRIPEMVELSGTLLDRLISQRWLNLLDVSDSENSDARLNGAQGGPHKRDGWIVVGGSLAAAVGLIIAAKFGISLALAIPAVTVFLMGPATLWGSRQVGLTPRNLLESVRSSMSGQTDGRDPSSSPETGQPSVRTNAEA